MNVLLFGASGGIGREVRQQALAAGHQLVLFARNPSALEPITDRERVIEGDIADAILVGNALAGVDGVVSVLGPTSNTKDQVALFETFAQTLVAAMGAHGVRRVVTISGGAVDVAGDRKSLRARIVSAMVRRIVPHVVQAKQRELDVFAASDLEWVAPRPPRVVEGPATGRYAVGNGAKGLRITQGDLAQFIVRQLTEDDYLRQAPFVSN